MTIEPSNLELFKDLTSFEQNGKKYDLHNNFGCKTFKYDSENQSLSFQFEAFEIVKENRDIVVLNFTATTLAKFSFEFLNPEDFETVNSFYRGRFEDHGKLFEYTPDGRSYFYLEFESGFSLEFFSGQIQFLEI